LQRTSAYYELILRKFYGGGVRVDQGSNIYILVATGLVVCGSRISEFWSVSKKSPRLRSVR